ncbi:hypothetical protein [Streptomyces sp. 8N706]|uniref:hypothetical protein n=1 Tax=Streptomyces sp. 8N706 TaxID=3457416 RepID=UPI003FD5F684
MDSQPAPVARDDRAGEEPGQAEVEEVWPRDGQIRVVGFVPGDSTDAPAALVARIRGHDDGEVRAETVLRGGRFDARLAVRDLASVRAPAEQTWDLYLAPADRAEELRLGRHLDDIRGKKKIFTYPAQTERSVRVEPYFTIKDNLSVVCHGEAA